MALHTMVLHSFAYECVRYASVSADLVRVSVVIPNYNTARFVGAAIRSALEQTYSAIEVIVVDDESTDDSVEQILSIEDSRLTCAIQKNRGVSGARNTGIQLARTRYIAFLDSDDIWHPEKLSLHLARMEANRTVGLTFSHSAYLDESGEPTGDYLMSACERPDAWQLTGRNHIGNGSTPVVRKECFDVAGGFDEGLRSCEDWECWVRIAATSGFAIQLIPHALTGYRIRPGSLSLSSDSYDTFVRDGLEAVKRFGRSLPEISPACSANAIAQLYRVTSQKAIANGHVAQSRSYLFRAFRCSPSAIVTDPRALIMTVFHIAALLVPRNMHHQFYRISRATVRAVLFCRIGKTNRLKQPGL